MKKLLLLIPILAVATAACRGVDADQGVLRQLRGSRATATAAPFPTRTPTRRPSPTRTPIPTPTHVVHIVQGGETLESIAAQYGVTAEAIAMRNSLGGIVPLSAGQVLAIPARYHPSAGLSWGKPSGQAAGPALVLASPVPRSLATGGQQESYRVPGLSDGSQADYHVVRVGDTLNAIAQLHGVSLLDIVILNGLSDPDLIHAGQILWLRAGAPIPSPTRIYVTPTLRPTSTPPSGVAPRSCCKYCCKGKPCGDSCIARNETCHKGVGCACWEPGCGP